MTFYEEFYQRAETYGLTRAEAARCFEEMVDDAESEWRESGAVPGAER